ncbi:MAG: phosphate regulon sensor histidine kinase PhoR [Gammaproteobacteria bacterium]|nr:phosphate regulon sensor histidine kinase PhoR [Gammaproteobacteria bacterium]
MRNIWIHESWRLLRFILPALLFGWVFDALTVCLFIALILFIVHQYRQFSKVYQWLGSSLDTDLEVSGLWEELVYRIYRKRKRSRSRKKSLSKMLRRFQDSVSMMPDAAIVLDKENNILWLNPAATNILHLSSDDIGQNVGNLIRLPAFIHFLKRSAQGESFEMKSPVDEKQSLDLRLMPYGVGQQLLLIRNISQVQRLKVMRQEFVANVSHELRTPLTVILGYLESLQEVHDLSVDEIKQQMQKLHAPAHRMNQIVADLLLLSRLDLDVSSELTTSPELDIAVLLAMLKKDAEQLSQGKHSIVLNTGPKVSIKAIESEIYSAISNLISNAIRYSPDGGEIQINSCLDNKGYTISVSDQGLGIAPEHLTRLTERFYRVDAGRSREVGGTGLGLAIVNQICRRHDAVLSVHSEPGKGSTFSCQFPLSRLHSESKK